MKATLPKLFYKYSDLEPYIDTLTMEIHHTKHHQGYVDNFNKAVEGLETDLKSAEEMLKNIDKIPEKIRQSVINNAGGHVNHSFFWKIMSPQKSEPGGKLKEMINSKFGSIDKFKQIFSESALSLFGSGWVFLIKDKKEGIKIKRHSFQNSPLIYQSYPILGIDLWEHAYYLKYQNRRVDYVNAWWNVVDWDRAEHNYINALKASH